MHFSISFKFIILAFAKSWKSSNVLPGPDSNKYSSIGNQTIRLNKLNSGSMLNHTNVQVFDFQTGWSISGFVQPMLNLWAICWPIQASFYNLLRKKSTFITGLRNWSEKNCDQQLHSEANILNTRHLKQLEALQIMCHLREEFAESCIVD